MKSIEVVMFDEFDGLKSRFNDSDYVVYPKERRVIDEYVDSLLYEARQNGFISYEDFRMMIHMIELFESVWKKDVASIAYDIYDKMDLFKILDEFKRGGATRKH